MESVERIVARGRDASVARREGEAPVYSCYACEDTGFVAVGVGEDGEVISMRAFGGRGTDLASYRLRPCKCKDESLRASLIAASGIDPREFEHKTMNNFKTDTVHAKQMKAVALSFLQHPDAQGMAMLGNSGTGKTHLCIAVLSELIKQHQGIDYFNYRTQIQYLKSLNFEGTKREEALNKWKMANVLYIDDLFKFLFNNDHKVDMAELRIMYEILDARYINKKKTIISSEYSVGEIMREIDSAIGSRIAEMVGEHAYYAEGRNERTYQFKR